MVVSELRNRSIDMLLELCQKLDVLNKLSKKIKAYWAKYEQNCCAKH